MIVSVNRRLAPRNRAAFTLLEIMVVVVILVFELVLFFMGIMT